MAAQPEGRLKKHLHQAENGCSATAVKLPDVASGVIAAATTSAAAAAEKGPSLTWSLRIPPNSNSASGVANISACSWMAWRAFCISSTERPCAPKQATWHRYLASRRQLPGSYWPTCLANEQPPSISESAPSRIHKWQKAGAQLAR